MYCKHCGRYADEGSLYCSNCGNRFDNENISNNQTNESTIGFAFLGFFIPIVGLILYLVYDKEHPKRAKSAGKGALIGVITYAVLFIILIIIYVVFAISLFKNSSNIIESSYSSVNDIFIEDNVDDILDKYVDVSFGEFNISSDGYFYDTSLDITIKNKAEIQCSYYITIEAVDANGARLETDRVCADNLNPGQEMHLTAFEYVEEDQIEQLKNATFKVLEIDKYDF